MGYLPLDTIQEQLGLGPLRVEVKRDSFRIYGKDGLVRPHVYVSGKKHEASVTFLVEDVQHLLAALSLVERVASGEKGL